MSLPFSSQQFLQNFANYNRAVFPAQVLLYVLAIILVLLAIRKPRLSALFISVSLASFWLWMGMVYHIIFFSAINKAAYGFGIAFILEGLLFLFFGKRKKLSFKLRPDVYGITGGLLILFALIAYPAWGYLNGHSYPFSPTFGLPCPTTIFTFGLLLFADRRIPIAILIIPVLWSIIGFSAAFSLGIYEDISLPVTALLASILIIVKNRHLSPARGIPAKLS